MALVLIGQSAEMKINANVFATWHDEHGNFKELTGELLGVGRMCTTEDLKNRARVDVETGDVENELRTDHWNKDSATNCPEPAISKQDGGSFDQEELHKLLKEPGRVTLNAIHTMRVIVLVRAVVDLLMVNGDMKTKLNNKDKENTTLRVSDKEKFQAVMCAIAKGVDPGIRGDRQSPWLEIDNLGASFPACLHCLSCTAVRPRGRWSSAPILCDAE
jgi:hypothetical protein